MSEFLLAPLEGEKVMNRTPKEGSGWGCYIIKGFSVEPLIGDSGWNLSQIVQGIIS